MKKEVLVVFLVFGVVMLIGGVSGEAECSDGSELDWDQKEIDVGEARMVKGVGIGVISAREISVYSRFSAKLLIDAADIVLINENSTVEAVFAGSTEDVKLINLTATGASITVGGSLESLDVDDLGSVGDISILLVETNSVAEPNAKVLLGKQEVSLVSDGNVDSKFSIGNVSYVVELFSASSTGANLKVYTCKTGVIELIVEEVVEEEETNDTVVNDTVVEEEVVEEEVVDPNQLTIEEANKLREEGFTSIEEAGYSSVAEAREDGYFGVVTEEGDSLGGVGGLSNVFSGRSLNIILLVVGIVAVLGVVVLFIKRKKKEKGSKLGISKVEEKSGFVRKEGRKVGKKVVEKSNAIGVRKLFSLGIFSRFRKKKVVKPEIDKVKLAQEIEELEKKV